MLLDIKDISYGYKVNLSRVYNNYKYVYSQNNKTPKYMKKELGELKGNLDNLTIIVGKFLSPFSIMARIIRQEINKDVEDVSDTINQVHLADNYKEVHSARAEFIFFIQAHMK